MHFFLYDYLKFIDIQKKGAAWVEFGLLNETSARLEVFSVSGGWEPILFSFVTTLFCDRIRIVFVQIVQLFFLLGVK